MVFYRKYRPQTIHDLDSTAVRESLTAVLSQVDQPHAFLFTGPKGLGKTSTARIVAKAINCEKVSKGIEPCNTCSQCISITNGSHVDIIEIDGASNRNIDDVRDLKEKIILSPASARKKVYIIDEVHMFTTESFNALLKTLEEPPAHAMFILCTTEKYKVPATIVSRCFAVDFQPAIKEEIIRSFQRIVSGEKLIIDEETLGLIADLADNGFRDGHKILEELVGLARDKTVTKELVESRYKVGSMKYEVGSMIEALQKKDAKEGLQIIQKVVDEGMDVKQFLFQLLEKVHELLLQQVGVGDTKGKEMENGKWKMENLRDLLLLLNKTFVDMKYAVLPQLPLELAIIEWIQKNGELKKEEAAVENKVTVKTNSTVTVNSMRKQMGDLARVKALYGEPKVMKTGVIIDENGPSISLMNVSNTEITTEWLNHFWNTLIVETKQYNHTLAGLLRGCTVKSYDSKSLIIEAAYKFHKDKLDDGKTRTLLEQVCKTLTGNTVTVEVVLKRG